MKIEGVLRNVIRFGIALLAVSFVLLSTFSMLFSNVHNLYFWLCSSPLLLITILEITFITYNLSLKPKDIDMKLPTVVICLMCFFAFLISNYAISFSKPTINTFFKSIAACLNLLTFPLVLSALFTLRSKLTVLPEAHSIVKTGVYKYLRHPLYLAYIMALMAGMLIFNYSYVLIINTSLIILFIIRARLEEKILEENIEDYKDYKKQTYFIPGLKWL